MSTQSFHLSRYLFQRSISAWQGPRQFMQYRILCCSYFRCRQGLETEMGVSRIAVWQFLPRRTLEVAECRLSYARCMIGFHVEATALFGLTGNGARAAE